jgi:hypothetical protein
MNPEDVILRRTRKERLNEARKKLDDIRILHRIEEFKILSEIRKIRDERY